MKKNMQKCLFEIYLFISSYSTSHLKDFYQQKFVFKFFFLPKMELNHKKHNEVMNAWPLNNN